MADVPFLKFWGKKRLPIILQGEAAECGLACIAMVASYWGHEIDIPSMRRRFSVSIKGTTLKSLVGMAQALGLQTRPLKLELKEICQLALPCILHWDMNHFVVLGETTRAGVKVHDPAIGLRYLSIEEFSRHFTGVAVEAAPGGMFRSQEERQTFTYRELLGRVVGLVTGLSKILLLGIVLQVLALVAPFSVQWIVDDALVSADRNLITIIGVGFILLVVLQTSIGTVRAWVTTALATSIKFQWYGNVFAHLLGLPLSYFEKRHLGDIVSRFGSINAIQSAITTQVVEGVIDGLLVILTLVVMTVYSLPLAAVAMTAVAIYGLMRLSTFQLLRVATSEQILRAAKQQTLFLESVRGLPTIRLFGRAGERRALWMNVLAQQMNAELRIAKFSVSFQAANAILFGVERVLIIWLGAFEVLRNHFSIGMLFAFLSYKDQFSQRISSLIDKLLDLKMLRVQGERLADIVLTKREEDEQEHEIDVRSIEPAVELKRLSFQYAESEPFVLRDFSLSVPAGQCLAITGASGCGKTTLVKVVLGLLEPTEGEILIGGRSLRHMGLANYRTMTGSVMQEDGLFSGSIAENIALFEPGADQARIEECALLAAIDGEIKSMPMGYSTLVGDLGTGLSGGQKQRVVLARALYRSPKILVLDEATSHIDAANEQVINVAIRQLRMTRIVVAHRRETIAMADRVIEIANGNIVRDVRGLSAEKCLSDHVVRELGSPQSSME